jgi:hypothetical protein
VSFTRHKIVNKIYRVRQDLQEITIKEKMGEISYFIIVYILPYPVYSVYYFLPHE